MLDVMWSAFHFWCSCDRGRLFSRCKSHHTHMLLGRSQFLSHWLLSYCACISSKIPLCNLFFLCWCWLVVSFCLFARFKTAEIRRLQLEVVSRDSTEETPFKIGDFGYIATLVSCFLGIFIMFLRRRRSKRGGGQLPPPDASVRTLWIFGMVFFWSFK